MAKKSRCNPPLLVYNDITRDDHKPQEGKKWKIYVHHPRISPFLVPSKLKNLLQINILGLLNCLPKLDLSTAYVTGLGDDRSC